MPESFLSKLVNLKILKKSPAYLYLRLNERVWSHLPSTLTRLSIMRSYGHFLHKLVGLKVGRRQFFGTFFFRNRPELELIRRFSDNKAHGSTLRISVIGCSNGAEVYSILWTIRSARPDLNVVMHAMDISHEVLDVAQKGAYSLEDPGLVEEPIFNRITEEEMREMFDRDGDQAKIKSWIKEGIKWHHGDAGNPEMIDLLGPQDMIVANNFLCHMDPPDAERCLRNIARLLDSGGYLFVSGIDLDVRTRVALDLGWRPVLELMDDIHNGDPVLCDSWPLRWWGLEPLNKGRSGWKTRYSSVFQLDEKS